MSDGKAMKQIEWNRRSYEKCTNCRREAPSSEVNAHGWFEAYEDGDQQYTRPYMLACSQSCKDELEAKYKRGDF